MTVKGFRTIIVNGLVILAAVGAAFGVIIPQDEQAAVVAGAVAAANIVLRFYTSTSWGQSG